MEHQNEISRLAPSFLPATAVLEVTYKCNHECLFCSCPWEDKKGPFLKEEELSIEAWKKIIALLCQKGIMNIAFTGGEPLMKKGIEELIEYAASCTTEHIETVDGKLVSKFAPPNLFLISNAKIMSNQIIELCVKHNVHLSMSLPGLSTFKYHTQGGNPDRVLHYFEIAKQAGLSTTVNVTVTHKNLHELFETISAGLIAGADNLLMNRFLPGGRGLKHFPKLMLNKDEVLEMIEVAEGVLKKANRKGSVGTELPKCIMKDRAYEFLTVGTRCSAAIDFFVIGPSGYLRTCNHSPVNVGHINEFEKIKDHQYWKTFVFKKYIPKHCLDCEIVSECDGGCREAANIFSGTIDAPDPLFVKK